MFFFSKWFDRWKNGGAEYFFLVQLIDYDLICCNKINMLLVLQMRKEKDNMNKTCKLKKRWLAGLMAALLLSSILSYVPKAEAANVPYSSPWGVLYRTPEYQSKYGRVWWQKLGKKQGGNIAIDNYYSYGSAVSVVHQYKYNGKTKKVKETGSSLYWGSTAECIAGGRGAGISTVFHAGAYGINFNKTVKY